MRWRRTDSAPVARQAASTRPPPPATTHVEAPLGSKESSRNESQSIFYGKISIYKKTGHFTLRTSTVGAASETALCEARSASTRLRCKTIFVPHAHCRTRFADASCLFGRKKLKFVGVITVVFLALCRFVVRKMYLLLFAV